MNAVAFAAIVASLITPDFELQPTLVATEGEVKVNVDSVIESADGKCLYVGGRWIDVESGKDVQSPIRIPDGWSLDKTFADGRYLVSRNNNRGFPDLALYDPKQDKPLIVHSGEDRLIPVNTPDGRFGIGINFNTKKGVISRHVGRLDEPMERWKTTELLDSGDLHGDFCISDDGSSAAWYKFYWDDRKLVIFDGKAVEFRKLESPEVSVKVDNVVFARDGSWFAIRTEDRLSHRYDLAKKSWLKYPERKSDSDFKSVCLEQVIDDAGTVLQIARKSNTGLARWLPIDPKAEAVVREIDSLWGESIVIARDRKRLWAVSKFGNVQQIDLATGKNLRDWNRHPCFASVLALDRDRAIVNLRSDEWLLWDRTKGTTANLRIPATGEREEIITNRERTELFVDDNGTTKRYRTNTGLPIRDPWEQGGGQLHPLHDGRIARIRTEVTTADDRVPKTIFEDAKTGRVIVSAPSDAKLLGREIYISSSGKTVLSATDAERLHSIESNTGELRTTFEVNKHNSYRVIGIRIRSEQQHAVLFSNQSVDVYKMHTGERLEEHNFGGILQKHGSTHTEDARWWAIAGEDRINDGHDFDVRLYDLDDAKFADGPTFFIPNPKRDRITGLSFSPDGSRLFVAYGKGICECWDVSKIHARQGTPWAKKDKYRDPWDRLGADAKTAGTTMEFLREMPEYTAKLIAENLKPALAPKEADAAAWLADLNHVDYARRAKAYARLEPHAEALHDRLKRELDDATDAEAIGSLRKLIDRAERDHRPADGVRTSRALELLEELGTPEAKAVLEGLTKGVPKAKRTIDAKEALERLNAREKR